MTKKEVIAYFGNQNQTAKALGISRQAVSNWQNALGKNLSARIEKLTNGGLKA